MAATFSERAVASLDLQEYHQLLDLLERQQDRDDHGLEMQIHGAVQQFHQAETAISQQSTERLGYPGGFCGADLALVLHLRTQDMFSEEPSDILDFDGSPTIDLLKNKGISSEFTFGIDWHWRGESRDDLNNRTNCPFKKWGVKLRRVHDDFSWRILEMISARFVVTGSACARNAIRQRLPSAKQLEVDGLSLDLDFRVDKLQRIILHLPHPSAGFWSAKDEKVRLSDCLDKGLNFMLWLTGHKFTHNTFHNEYARHVNHSFEGHAMVRATHSYRRIENEGQRKLRLDEYTPEYQMWAERRLRCTATSVLHAGHSLAKTVLAPIRQKQSETHTRRNAKMRRQNSTPSIRQPAVTESIQGKPAHISPRGAVKILRSHPQLPLQFRLFKDVAARILAHKGTPVVHFTVEQVQIFVDGHSCYSRSHQQLIQSPNWGEEWLDQLQYEVGALGGTPPQMDVPQRTRLQDSEFPGCSLFQGEYVLKGKYCYYDCIRLNFSSAPPNSTIQLRVELADQGFEHPNMVCQELRKSDPGCRLGIWARYNIEAGFVEGWQKMRGESNIAKINTLVDLEGGCTRQLIASKPRRYLKAFQGQSHWYS